ncbi:MAG: VanW family protein [Coriobacteriales bacterium]|jgi:vancomycin resistance protein YoaR|nr:VanW family protein [Coriobacteriales bacterium]
MKQEGRFSAFKRFMSRGSAAEVPLLFVCCLFMVGYMVAGYTILHETAFSEDNTAFVAEQEAAGQSSNTDESEPDEPAPEDDTVIGSYTATSSSEEPGRVDNIRLAAEAINGTLIGPGETFSFNEHVGDVEHDERYQLAPVVNGDEMIYGRGGGSCQVSSALYVAALYSDVRVVERHAHSTVVDYVPIGLDATVVYGALDLRIANESEYPVTIQATAEGQSVTVQFWGMAEEEGIRREVISELIEYHEAGTPVQNAVEWNPELENTTYYVVESFRECYYHGIKQETVFLARDTYGVLSDSTVRMADGSLEATK